LKYRNSVEFQVEGKYALFSDPITRVGGEKCTYQVPTYEALKGILSSVYWKPTFIWIVDKVRVMNQIQTEVKGVRPLNYSSGGNELAYYTYLKDCRYQVQAHFVWNENRPELAADRNENKHYEIAKRMIRAGGRRDVFLGTRECQAYVTPCTFHEGKGFYDDTPELAFGLMVHGITYPDEAHSEKTRGKLSVRLWRPVMRRGVIDFIPPEACSIVRPVIKMGIKPFDSKHGNFTGLAEFEEDCTWG